jgi:hypothetical protein
MLRAIAAAKQKNDKIDASKMAAELICDWLLQTQLYGPAREGTSRPLCIWVALDFSAHFLHTRWRTTSRKPQSDSPWELMPDQSTHFCAGASTIRHSRRGTLLKGPSKISRLLSGP